MKGTLFVPRTGYSTTFEAFVFPGKSDPLLIMIWVFSSYDL